MTERVAISDLYVQCSLQVINLGTGYMAMSDCCRAPASYAVVRDDGIRLWRCKAHRSTLRVDKDGTVEYAQHVNFINRKREDDA